MNRPEFHLPVCPANGRDRQWRHIQRLLGVGAPVTALLVWLSIRFIDLDLGEWLHRTGIDRWTGLRKLLDLPIWMAPVGAVYLIYYAASGGSRRDARRHNLMAISVCMSVAFNFKNLLKIAFGRSWPRDVSGGDADLILPLGRGGSYLGDGTHVFHAFSGLKAYTAFPSGTTISVIATLVPICWCYPRLRWASAALGVATMFALVQTNTHFLSDVIAGCWVGMAIGMSCIPFLWRVPGVATPVAPAEATRHA